MILSETHYQCDEKERLDPAELSACDLTRESLTMVIHTSFPDADMAEVDRQLDAVDKDSQLSSRFKSGVWWHIVRMDKERIVLCGTRYPLVATNRKTAPNVPRRVVEIYPGQPHPDSAEKMRERAAEVAEIRSAAARKAAETRRLNRLSEEGEEEEYLESDYTDQDDEYEVAIAEGNWENAMRDLEDRQ